jgi:3-phosphoglycerate kinase
MRVIDSTIVFGLDFTPENYILLRRLVESTKQIYLAGLSAAKFYLAKHKLDRLGNIEISKSERDIISHFLSDLEAKGYESKIVVPTDFTLEKHVG